tara:strand:- start:401 stop:802 length:402 start_codon:yes stop_codon:yes gene_type:complete
MTCYSRTNEYRREVVYRSLRHYARDKFSKQKSQSKKRGIEWTITFEDVWELLKKQKGNCSVTGIKMTYHKVKDVKNKRMGTGVDTNISFDRIDARKGYTADNVRLVCYAVNYMKSDMTDTKLKSWAKRLYENL